MSKSNKKAVGQGIKALLSNIDKKQNKKSSPQSHLLVEKADPAVVEIKYLEANPWQPRKDFDHDKLEELAYSIKTHGIIQPIAVRRLNSTSYQIISGERRWRAAKKIGLKSVPVHIIEADDQTMLEVALLENIQRDDLNHMEVALSYQRLIDECNLTHEDLSERLGKKRSSISNHLRLLRLSPSVQEALREDKITMGHAKALAGVERLEIQTMLLGNILNNELSVRDTESLVRKSKAPNTKNRDDKSNEQIDPNVKKLEDDLSLHLGAKAKIKASRSGSGQLVINFRNNDELSDIIEAILDN